MNPILLAAEQAAANPMVFAYIAMCIAFGLALAAFGGALGQSRATAAALEGMARQPEAAAKIQTAMIIGLALIESLVIYVLLICFLLLGSVAPWQEILGKAAAH